MRNMFHFKKIAAIVMTAALAIPTHVVFAEEIAETEAVETQAATEAVPEPVVEQPAAEPVCVEPVPEEPVTEAPVYEEPATEAPMVEETETATEETNEETTADTEEAITDTETEEVSETNETEQVSETEAETETETKTETESEEYLTELSFENDEVKITAYVCEEVKLPKNAKIKATKLEEGSAAFEEAKAISMRDLGTAEDAQYKFYDVIFTVDGEETEIPENAASIRIEFKNILEDETVVRQSALHIEENANGKKAQDVTAAAGNGNIRSVDFMI